MNANEARRITIENLNGPVIEATLKVIYQRIREAAQTGVTHISDPCTGLSAYVKINNASEKAIHHALRAQGYTVEFNPNDSDPGDPRARAFWTVSW